MLGLGAAGALAANPGWNFRDAGDGICDLCGTARGCFYGDGVCGRAGSGCRGADGVCGRGIRAGAGQGFRGRAGR